MSRRAAASITRTRAHLRGESSARGAAKSRGINRVRPNPFRGRNSTGMAYGRRERHSSSRVCENSHPTEKLLSSSTSVRRLFHRARHVETTPRFSPVACPERFYARARTARRLARHCETWINDNTWYSLSTICRHHRRTWSEQSAGKPLIVVSNEIFKNTNLKNEHL